MCLYFVVRIFSSSLICLMKICTLISNNASIPISNKGYLEGYYEKMTNRGKDRYTIMLPSLSLKATILIILTFFIYKKQGKWDLFWYKRGKISLVGESHQSLWSLSFFKWYGYSQKHICKSMLSTFRWIVVNLVSIILEIAGFLLAHRWRMYLFPEMSINRFSVSCSHFFS